MKFFLDTANLQQIQKAKDWGILDGVTTNPSLIAKEGVREFHAHIKRICEVVQGPVSAEVISPDSEGMLREARQLAKIDEHVVIKVPVTPEGIKTVVVLSKENIHTNVTLVFSACQALLAMKAGATYISPFLGRVDDIGWESMDLLEDLLIMVDAYGFDTEVIAASVRHPRHVVDAARLGCHIATVPYQVLEAMFFHPQTENGIQKFIQDWNTLQDKLRKEG
jgi:transaldolase